MASTRVKKNTTQLTLPSSLGSCGRPAAGSSPRESAAKATFLSRIPRRTLSQVSLDTYNFTKHKAFALQFSKVCTTRTKDPGTLTQLRTKRPLSKCFDDSTPSRLNPPRCPARGNSSATILQRSPNERLPRPMKIRRTFSMMDTPKEFVTSLVKECKDSAQISSALSPWDYKEQKECVILPCYDTNSNDPFKRISPDTLSDVLDGQYTSKYDHLYLIDCRFPYEYTGGHIDSAININDYEELEKLLLRSDGGKPNTLIIFHCEFSCMRAPRMALHLRSRDRHANLVDYPKLYYPEIYLLDGGYSRFFQSYKHRCTPQSYVGMKDAAHAKDFQLYAHQLDPKSLYHL